MHDIAPDDAGPVLIREWINRAARLHPNKPYIESVEDGRAITFGEFARLIRRIGSFLDRNGIGTNDRVALLAHNSIEHVACYIGVMAYGATICTVHVEMNRHHLGQILVQLKPRLVVYDDDLICDTDLAANSSPPPCEEGMGAGVEGLGTVLPTWPDPPPHPSPTGGEGVPCGLL
jgi:acyl-CoA synthetase (AMP-forming)/AMP-acid ligase II